MLLEHSSTDGFCEAVQIYSLVEINLLKHNQPVLIGHINREHGGRTALQHGIAPSDGRFYLPRGDAPSPNGHQILTPAG